MNNLNNQKPGDVIRVTTTIDRGTDIPAVGVIELKSDDEVGQMHSDILSGDVPVIPKTDGAESELKKQKGSRFDMSEIIKSYGAFTNATKTLLKEKVQKEPLKRRKMAIPISTNKNDFLLSRFKDFLGKQIHIKLEDDDSAVLYTLKEIEKDYLVVKYGESQRFIPVNKIIFLQIGDYPKE